MSQDVTAKMLKPDFDMKFPAWCMVICFMNSAPAAYRLWRGMRPLSGAGR
jgi:hypothetical protein